MTSVVFQHCDSHGEDLCEMDDDYIVNDKYENNNILLRHKCAIDASVFYFKTMEESLAWGIYTDDKDTTRCQHCNGLWPIFIPPEMI